MLIAQTTALRNDSSHGIIHIHCIFWRPGDHYTLIGRCPNYVIAFIPSNMLMCDQRPRAHKSGTYFLNTAGTCTAPCSSNWLCLFIILVWQFSAMCNPFVCLIPMLPFEAIGRLIKSTLHVSFAFNFKLIEWKLIPRAVTCVHDYTPCQLRYLQKHTKWHTRYWPDFSYQCRRSSAQQMLASRRCAAKVPLLQRGALHLRKNHQHPQ